VGVYLSVSMIMNNNNNNSPGQQEYVSLEGAILMSLVVVLITIMVSINNS